MEMQENVSLTKYKILQKIGSGSFGYIYLCEIKGEENEQRIKQQYAAKIQKKGKGEGQLKMEIKMYQLFQGKNGIAKLIDYGNQNQRLYLVIELLGHSLEDLFQMCGKKFSLLTTFYIAIQLIERLQIIHSHGYIHRDIKANNFMIGLKNINTIYAIDFGLTKSYKDKYGTHIARKGGKSLVGTARYASIASHQGYQQCRRDDLQSLGYMLLYFIRGRLPWQGLLIQDKTQKYAQIGSMKKKAQIKKLCLSIGPSAIAIDQYLDKVKALGFEDEPKYQQLRKIFIDEIVKMNKQKQKISFDWEEPLIKLKEKQQ